MSEIFLRNDTAAGMSNNFLRKFFWLPFAILHLPFVFSESALWDSLVQTQTYQLGIFDCSTQFSFDSGVPLSALIWQLGRLPYFIFIFKFAMLACYITSSFLFRTIIQRLFGFDDYWAFVAINVAFLFPAYSMWYHIIMLPYVISLTAFLAAVVLYIKRYPHNSVPTLLVISVLSIVAFNIRSFLVFHLAALFCVFIAEMLNTENRIKSFAFFIQRNLILIVLPFIYYVLLAINFPLGGLYKVDQYNVIQFSISNVFVELGKSIINTLFTPFYFLLKYVISDGTLLMLIFAFCLGSFLLLRKKGKAQVVRTKPILVALLGLMFLSALIPYALVGKHVTTHGYETRHALLAIFPLIIIVIICFQKLFSNTIVLSFFLALVASAFFYNEVLWQNRFTKYEWTIDKLKSEKNILKEVVFFEDNAVVGMNEYFRFYECNIILQRATHSSAHIGISENPKNYNRQFVNQLSKKYSCCKDCLFFEGFDESKASEYNKVIIKQTEKRSELQIWINNLTHWNPEAKLPLKLEISTHSF